MYTNDKGEVIIPIGIMLAHLDADVPALIQVGYEQASCNEESAVDFDDAVRIFIEREYVDNKYFFGTNRPIAQESLHLYSTMLKVSARARWQREFPYERAPMEYAYKPHYTLDLMAYLDGKDNYLHTS